MIQLNTKSKETKKTTIARTSIGLVIVLAVALSSAPLIIGSIIPSAAARCLYDHAMMRCTGSSSGTASNTGTNSMYIKNLEDQLVRNYWNSRFGSGLAGGLGLGGFSMGSWT
jgi:hypothetical protein